MYYRAISLLGPGVGDFVPSVKGIILRKSAHPALLPRPNTSTSPHASPLVPRPELSPSTQVPHPLPSETTILLMCRTPDPHLQALAPRLELEIQALDLEARKPLPTTRERHLQCKHDRVCGQDLQGAKIRRPGCCRLCKSAEVFVQLEGEHAVEDVVVAASALRVWLYDDCDGARVKRKALEDSVHLVVHDGDAVVFGSGDQLRELDYCVHVVAGSGAEKVGVYRVLPVDALDHRNPAQTGLAVFMVELFLDLATCRTQRSRHRRRRNQVRVDVESDLGRHTQEVRMWVGRPQILSS